jgi:hypothetical protein
VALELERRVRAAVGIASFDGADVALVEEAAAEPAGAPAG